MDFLEKRVIRKSRQCMENCLELNVDFFDDLLSSGLFTEEMVRQVKNERMSVARYTRFVDLLMNTTPNAFEMFCGVLVKDYPWLSKELMADLNAERGCLQIDPDVEKEAAMLVHRKFGTSKRLCETDKKDITELIALKIQISKEEWKRELSMVRDDLELQIKANKSKDHKISRLLSTVKKFAKDKHTSLCVNAHDMITTTETLTLSEQHSNMDLADKLTYETKRLLTKVDKLLSRKDMLAGEREKCLRMLEVNDDRVPLDEALNTTLKQLKYMDESGTFEGTDSAKKLRGNLVKRLNKRVTDLETELSEKEEQIKELESKLANISTCDSPSVSAKDLKEKKCGPEN